MPRNKRGSFAPRGGGGGGRGRRGQAQSYRGQSFGLGHEQNAGFTLADEARRTLQDDHAWENATLRRMPVKFLSAGSMNTNDEHKNQAVDDASVATIPDHDSTPPDSEIVQEKPPDDVSSPFEQGIGAGRDEPQPFFFDVKRRRPIDRDDIAVVIPERPSSPESASDSEEIIFQGRNKFKRSPPKETMSLTTIHTELKVVEQQLGPTLPSISKARPVPATDDVLGVGTSHRRRKSNRKQPDSDEEAILADYIANLHENGEFDDLQNASEQESSESDSDEDQSTKKQSQSTWPTSKKKSLASDADFEGLFSSSSPSDTDPQEPLAHEETFDDFDIMDWERPSLRKKSKGKWSQVSSQFPDLDPDLEQVLQAAWKNDRLKKSERKKQREDLRAMGLLGKRTGTGDLMAKYPTGISLPQVAEELKAFLLRNDECLALPPMDQHARKIVHELANKFNLKSKSIGQGDQRRPTLHRKKGTLRFEEQRFEVAFNRINRKFFPRLGANDRSRRGAPSRSGDWAARLRDGEIVGGQAPELGVDNRGRTMLEKMGWSSGTALGALDNKGILQPVTQTVKRSKAGLG